MANRKITHWRDYMDRSRRGTHSPPEGTIFTRSCSPRTTRLLC
jgi:hypothetical protein